MNRYIFVLNNGMFSYPAWKRYGGNVTVICDKCRRYNIPACIGFENIDLCLLCANELSIMMSQPMLPMQPMLPIQPIMPPIYTPTGPIYYQ